MKITETEKKKTGELPSKIPDNIIDLHSKFRGKIDGVYSYIKELHDKTNPKNVPGIKGLDWSKWRKLRDMHKATQGFMNVYKEVHPITLNEVVFYKFLPLLVSTRRMVLVDWFHWILKSINEIEQLKYELIKERQEITREGASKELLKHYDYLINKLLDTETMTLFEDLKQIYHTIIVTSQNLKK